MKRFLIFSFFILLFSDSFAAHITGGEMIYQYLGPGSSPNTRSYRITLKLFRDNTGGGAAMPNLVRIGIFNNDNNSHIALSPFDISITSTSAVPVSPPPICMSNPPNLDYSVGVYEFVIDLPNNTNGYTAAYQTCCRINSLQNVFTVSPPGQGEGSTYICTIPGSNQLPTGVNSSPQFTTMLAPVCYRSNFTFNFGAFDPDGDSLVYTYCNAFDRGNSINSGNVTPSAPPYQSVGYINGYSGTNPLGSGAVLNRQTGLISGIAPNTPGKYVVCVCIAEYRNGVLIGQHRKDFILNVSDCNVPAAVLEPTGYRNCDGKTFTFVNLAVPDNILTYYWDFGDGNTSTAPTPTYTYADTGVYTLRLVVNRGLACSDSATALVRVFPGFYPDFTFGGQCQNIPVQFTDLTTADYGAPSKWNWNFGDFASTSNTSTIKNPTHTYSSVGMYNVVFIVETDKGCIDTLTKTIDIVSGPPLTLGGDTLICIIDTLQLNAVGTGTFLWSPNYMISNVNIANPLVSPDVTTTYSVRLTDAFGCSANESITVNVKPFVTQFAGPDTTICLTDTVVLKLTSDAVRFVWTENPAGNTLNDPTLKNPTARPLVTTTYHVVGNIGKCIAENDITVRPVPYPVANAGPDKTICLGGSAQLNASGGSIYSWSPSAFLTATNIPNPVSVNPTDNVRYVVTVRDVLGCAKSVKDTMILYVTNIKANAGPRDTSVVINQPLQLNASGSTNYSWTPSTWLNNPNISNPIALPQNDIEYIVRVSNDIGCFDTDSIRVHVFKIKPDLYVPNAFTPNGDGINNIFRPIPIGMKSIDIFRVYNRWGQMLYSGTGNGAGWDGRFAGRPQEAATYVWYAEGVDYLNNKIKRKGAVILIR